MAGQVIDIRARAPAPLDRVLVSGIASRGLPPLGGVAPTRIWEEVEYRSGPDGAIEVGPLSPGEYRVEVGGVAHKVAIRSGETTVLLLKVP